jgi:hypothetical protein
MGSGFCNFNRLGWNTQTPLPPSSLQAQRTLNCRKVGREDEGVSSTRPELVDLAECLEDHDDDVSLLYLTDSEEILQTIQRLVPTKGRDSRQDGGVSEENNSPISRSVEDAPSEYTQFPIELLVT